jgi:hypothetical protein
MSDLRELLREAAFEPDRAPDVTTLRRRVEQRRRRRRITSIATVSVMGLGLLTAIVVSTRGEEPIEFVPPPISTDVPSTTAVPTTTVVATTSAAPTTSMSTSTSSTTSVPPTATVPLVTGANGLRAVSVRIVDPGGNPFPKGTVIAEACPTSVVDEEGSFTDVLALDNEPCALSTSNGVGETQVFELDPDETYEIRAIARNTGWPDPWISTSGEPFHFSDGVITSGANLRDGTVLAIDQFATSDLDGRGQSATSTYTTEFETCRANEPGQTSGQLAGCDELMAACGAGDLLACNDLYYSAPSQSRHELYGASCGERVRPGNYQWGGYCGEPPPTG